MTNKIQPLIPGNTEGLEEIARQLLEGVPAEPIDKGEKHAIILAEFIPEDFVLLQGRSQGNCSYSNLLVNMYRLGLNRSVETAAKNLGYSITNTAKESNGRDFIGNINWKQGLSLNLGLGGRTLSPRQYADFLGLLKSGNAVDGAGRKIPKTKLTEILDEITQVREPWRAEWLDADFKYLDGNLKPVGSDNPNGKLWIYSQHKLVNGNLDADYKKELEKCLMVKGARIDLKTINNQGIPVKEGNDFYYWCPDKDNNSVARFLVGSGRAYLYCYGGPTFTVSSLGVRLALPQGALTQKI